MELFLLLPALIVGPTLVYGQCCQTKVVTGMAGLDDTYTLADNRVDKPDDVCIDGCVYTRGIPDSPGDEYCFKTEMSNGEVQCQAGTTSILQNIESQKTSLEADVRKLEDEVEELENYENEAKNLTNELEKVDEKVEELISDVTPAGRVQRQAGQGPPASCDEIADIIEKLADTTKTNAERLVLVKRILQTTIKKCKSRDKLIKIKVKIITVKTETGERIKLILIKKSTKKAEIREKTKIIIDLGIQIEAIKGSTAKPLPTVSLNPTGELEVPINSTGEQVVLIGLEGSTLAPIGEIAVPINATGQQAVLITGEFITGEIAVPVNSTGQQAVEIDLEGSTPTPIGEIAVPINSTGQQAVLFTGEFTTGEIAVPVNSTGQQAVEIKPTGQQVVEMKPTGQQAVLFTGELGQSTVVPA